MKIEDKARMQEKESKDFEDLEDLDFSEGLDVDDINLKGPAPEEQREEMEKTATKIPKTPGRPPKGAAGKTSTHNPEEKAIRDEVVEMSKDIPVQLVAVIGKTTISLKDLMNYQMGQVIDLGRPPSETVDIVASGKLFARGELVDIDGKLGVRIVKLVK